MTIGVDGYVETEIGTFLADWAIVPVGDIAAEKIKNGAFVKRDQFGEGVPFLNVADIFKNISANLQTVVRVDIDESEVENMDFL